MATISNDDKPSVGPVAIDIDNLLAEDKTKFESTRRLNPSVSRVPAYVRKLKPDVYEAAFLPMGLLYNRGLKGITSVYQLKLEVLGCFLELLQVNKDQWETFCKEVTTQPSDSASPYLENFYENDGSYSVPTPESMQSHLITDAFFIVGLFIWTRKRKLIQKQKSGSDEEPRFLRRLKQIFDRGSLGSSVHALDLDICWLYEGQIPLFLLKNSWERVAEATRSVVEIGSFTAVLKKNLFRTLMYSGVAFDVLGCSDSVFKSCDHLLACVHKAIIGGEGEGDDDYDDASSDDDEEEHEHDDEEEGVTSFYKEEDEAQVPLLPDAGPDEEKDEGDTEEAQPEEGCFKSFISKHPIGTQIREFVATCVRKVVGPSDHYIRLTLPSATQLATTGVRFKCHDGITNEVRFEKSVFRLSATLYLARIYMGDFTETMLRNLCVYESMNRQDQGVHSCIMLMDELIDKEEDVELLMDGKDPIIAENRLGDNRKVVDIFTNPVQNLYFVKGDNFNRYATVRDEMIAWYNNPWRRRVVQFLNSYRVAPWLVVFLLAAIILLVLALLQTIYTIWGFYKPYGANGGFACRD